MSRVCDRCEQVFAPNPRLCQIEDLRYQLHESETRYKTLRAAGYLLERVSDVI